MGQGQVADMYQSRAAATGGWDIIHSVRGWGGGGGAVRPGIKEGRRGQQGGRDQKMKSVASHSFQRGERTVSAAPGSPSLMRHRQHQHGQRGQYGLRLGELRPGLNVQQP